MKRCVWLALSMLALALVGCAKPIPPEKSDYVGEWRAPTMAILILPEGRVTYRRREGGMSRSIDGPLKDFEGDDFVVGIGWIATTFIVSVPPHRDGTAWKMTVDGVELTRRQ